jgi:DNA invertase Pin-like site-specific DNA recombinase
VSDKSFLLNKHSGHNHESAFRVLTGFHLGSGLGAAVDALTRAGVDDRDIFREKQSGAKADRQELRRVLDLLRAGDKLVVWRLDRLARSQLHLLQIAKEIENKGAELVSLMDRIDTSTATGRTLFGILAVLSEFERNLIIERSKAGQAAAPSNGKKFGRPGNPRTDFPFCDLIDRPYVS